MSFIVPHPRRIAMPRSMSLFNYRRILVNLAPVALGACLSLSACAEDDANSPDNRGGAKNGGGAGVGTDAGAGGSLDEAGASPGGSSNGGASGGAGGAAGESPADAGAAGEGGAGGEAGAVAELSTSTPEQLTDESAADYASNTHGLIDGARLKSWVEDWAANRPAGVTGKLVVLQVVPNAAASKSHVAENANGVVSYLLPQSELLQVRDNGLSQIEAEIPGGAATDALLKKYGIDVTRDFVVLTFEQLPAEGTTPATANSIVQSVGRAWLTL